MSQRRPQTLLLLAMVGSVAACQTDFATPRPSPFPESTVAFEQEVLATGFEIPFDVAIVGEDDFFVTDRIGKLFRYTDGEVIEIKGVLPVTTFRDPGLKAILHGGLMDVALHPAYPETPWIYLAHYQRDTLRVFRVQVEGDRISEQEEIFATRTPGYYGNGSRIVWEDDDHFFLNVGGSTLSTESNPVLVAQDLAEDWGKIHRLRADGSVPDDNPIFDGLDAPLSIYSYGHRDSQGLWRDPDTGDLFGLEHGPKGGDEFNRILPGRNYGWPLFTYGIDYSGARVSTLTEEEAAETTVLPEHYWTVETSDGGQAIAPAFLLGIRDSNFDAWNGKYLLSSLFYRWLLVYDRDTDLTEAIPVTGRIRSAAQLPSGDLLVLRERTSLGAADGQLIRLSPR